MVIRTERQPNAERRKPGKRPGGNRRLLLLCAGALLALGPGPACLRAESGGSVTVPGVAPRNGLQLTLDTRWVGGSGYHPVRVAIRTAPAAPSPGQRTFRVELQMLGTSNPEPAVVSAYMNIEQGRPSGEATILVPQSDMWNSVNVTVYEDGVRLSELSSRVTLQAVNPAQVSEARPAVVFVSSEAPLIGQRANVIASMSGASARRPPTLPSPGRMTTLYEPTGTGRGDAATLQMLSRNDRATLRHPDELPEKWIAYTSADLIVMTLHDWLAMQQTHPRRTKSIQRWLRAGGNLALFDAALPEQRQALLDSVNAAPGDVVDSYLPSNGSLRNESAARYRKLKARPQNAADVRWPDGPKPTVLARVGLGQVVAADTPLLGAPSRVHANVLNEFGANRWKWYRRMGFSNFRDAGDYSTHNIPDVGDPPLLTFLLSITLFVIVIGPVNYLLLKRLRRLYMLLVTVPIGAAIVTIGIFVAAILGDGLGVKTLQRSFTDLDQVERKFATWCRQTYYAGVRPSSGLVYSDDVAVFPILNPGVRRELLRDRSLLWDDGKQQLTNGYLPSRRLEQFLTMQSGETKAGLAFAAAGQGWSVRNELGAEAVLIIATAPDGASLIARDLPAGESADLESGQAVAHLTLLKRQFNQTDPRRRNNPPVQRGNRYGSYAYYQFRQKLRQMDAGEQMPDSSTSLMERQIQLCLTAPPAQGAYYAVLKSCPWSEVGCDSVELDGGLHLVRGRWR